MSEHYTAADRVYFLRPVGQPGPVKIGCSFNPQSRLSVMMSWSPVPLEIVAICDGSFAEEARLHRVFALSHSHGEWFQFSDELGDVVRRAAAGEPLESILSGFPDNGHGAGRGKLAWTVGRRAYQATLTRAYAARKRAEAVRGQRLEFPSIVDEIADAVFRENRALTQEEEAKLSEIFGEPERHFPLPSPPSPTTEQRAS